MVTIHQIEQNTPEWFALREECDVTASEAFNFLRQGKGYKKSSFSGNFATNRGHLLEPEALELYHAIQGTQSIGHGFVTNSDYPRAGASPDDLTEHIYIEVKCFSIERHRACAKNPFVEVIAQIQFGLMISKYKLAHLVLYNPDLPADEALIILEVKPNKQIHANFKRELAK